jgi:CheY-like chemotaxis protein
MAMGKRALIVDDSRSARVILGRMLEQQGLAVDTAESAEQALEYLQRDRPDVIFMDHLMPGMDGFQAVQTIKSDPQTATIPLMMYTSQEGELYVSQARALGAVGVLPKTVRPVDVSRVLYQLHLLPDRRKGRSALFNAQADTAATADDGAASADAQPRTPISTDESAGALTVASASALSEMQASLRQSMQQLVRDQFSEQRRFVLSTFEAFARRTSAELKDGIAKIPVPPVIELPTQAPQRQWWPTVLTALLAVIPSLVLGYFYWQSQQRNLGLRQEVTDAREATEVARREAAVAAAAAAAAAPAKSALAGADKPFATEYVPYGETPLARRRLERLQGIVESLEAEGFRGRVVVESFVGDFCLSGGAAEGFSLADSALPSQSCDLVGNPFQDALLPAQNQSVEFANFIAIMRQRLGGAIQISVVNAGRSHPVAYPEQSERTTAGDWNAVAAQNNRVEFRVEPEPEPSE